MEMTLSPPEDSAVTREVYVPKMGIKDIKNTVIAEANSSRLSPWLKFSGPSRLFIQANPVTGPSFGARDSERRFL
jgi:hypothetical protein